VQAFKVIAHDAKLPRVFRADFSVFQT